MTTGVTVVDAAATAPKECTGRLLGVVWLRIVMLWVLTTSAVPLASTSMDTTADVVSTSLTVPDFSTPPRSSSLLRGLKPAAGAWRYDPSGCF